VGKCECIDALNDESFASAKVSLRALAAAMAFRNAYAFASGICPGLFTQLLPCPAKIPQNVR
jgi:hypothetical protein